MKEEERLELEESMQVDFAEKYIVARIAGYVIEELYGFVSEDIVVVCNEGLFRKMIGSSPMMMKEELEAFLEMEEKDGHMRMFQFTSKGKQVGWVSPPSSIEVVIEEIKKGLGGGLIRGDVMKC